MHKPRVGLLLGDPCGVGLEVAAKLLARPDTVARGTAFDIVGQGIANPEPMIRAFDMALRLAGRLAGAASPGAN